ncbi:hypothetical protein [Geomesophilobacter sediminis]|nr:hypothetical protein [Geomesophilobacter sediminis]
MRPPRRNCNQVYTDEGLDHAGTATSAYRDPRIYYWLLSPPKQEL